MHGPEPVGWLLVALCAGTGAYCLRWLPGGPSWWRRITAAEAAMGLGMAAMALPADLAPVFAVFFAAMAVWCVLLRRARVPHGAHHAVEAAAMVYMALAMAAAPAPHASHASHAPAGVPWLTGLLLAYFAGHALRTGRALVPAAPDRPRGAPRGGGRPGEDDHAARPCADRPPEMAAACRLTLSVAMVAMLVTL